MKNLLFLIIEDHYLNYKKVVYKIDIFTFQDNQMPKYHYLSITFYRFQSHFHSYFYSNSISIFIFDFLTTKDNSKQKNIYLFLIQKTKEKVKRKHCLIDQ